MYFLSGCVMWVCVCVCDDKMCVLVIRVCVCVSLGFLRVCVCVSWFGGVCLS